MTGGTQHLYQECSASIYRRGFCTPECKGKFYNLMSKRGRVIMPLLLAAATRRYRGHNPDVCAYARQQADALISKWLIQDREAGRSSVGIAGAKHELGWRACDVG